LRPDTFRKKSLGNTLEFFKTHSKARKEKKTLGKHWLRSLKEKTKIKDKLNKKKLHCQK
jgi:hypothetical protein